MITRSLLKITKSSLDTTMIFFHSLRLKIFVYHIKLLCLCLCILLISCGDDDTGVSDPVEVTGLENDFTPKQTKTWTWDCKIGSSAGDCTYRYSINKSTSDTSDTFAPSDEYDDTKTATLDTGTDTYYIHVQARSESSGRQSSVRSVSAILDNTPPDDPEQSDFKAPSDPSDSEETTFQVTVSDLQAKDTVRVYVEGGASSNSNVLNWLGSLFGWGDGYRTPSSIDGSVSENTGSGICDAPSNKVGEKTVPAGEGFCHSGCQIKSRH